MGTYYLRKLRTIIYYIDQDMISNYRVQRKPVIFSLSANTKTEKPPCLVEGWSLPGGQRDISIQYPYEKLITAVHINMKYEDHINLKLSLGYIAT